MVKVRGNIREVELQREANVKAFADFLKSVLPANTPSVVHRRPSTPTQTEARVAAAIPSTLSAAEIYETPKRRPSEDDDDNADVTGFVEAEAQEYGREEVGPVAGSYLTPYLYKRCFHDTQYDIRKEGDAFMIGDRG